MSADVYNFNKIQKIFGSDVAKSSFLEAEKKNLIPQSKRYKTGSVNRRGWSIEDLPKIGKKYGFLPTFDKCVTACVFTKKGGSLKTTLALNIARISALHGHRVLVIGLDEQLDITNALGINSEIEEVEDLQEADQMLSKYLGLYDVQQGRVQDISEIILQTEIPNLHIIPETEELNALNDSLHIANRREYWLQENVIRVLRDSYDLILFDCPPGFNKLVTNALVACDVLISPLECKINNYRNYSYYQKQLQVLKEDLKLNFDEIYIPTKYSSNKKLFRQIAEFYHKNAPGCTLGKIREGIVGEEAMANMQSFIEYQPNHIMAQEMRELMIEIFEIITKTKNKESSEVPYLYKQQSQATNLDQQSHIN